jgi:2'-5' RNA ligase
MRLFYAVNFEPAVIKRLVDIQDALRAQVVRGSFTLEDNLHLTLAFIGEVPEDRSGPLRRIAETFQMAPFELRLNGLGRFRREGGDILWLGIAENRSLVSIYNKLSEQIAGAGFKLEKRTFTPHLTLARQARLRPEFDLSAYSRRLEPIDTEVKKVSLMKSERLNGRLTYTEI